MTLRTALAALLFSFSSSATPAEPLDIFRDCDACPEMIQLPMGEFVMGAPDDEFRTNWALGKDGAVVKATPDNPAIVEENEGPQHKVTIDIRIAMGRNEITYDEWMACVNDGGCGGYVPDGEVAHAGSVEDVMRALTDPRFKHVPSEAAIALAIQNDGILTVKGRYPVVYVSYLDAQAYVAWLNRKLDTDAYRLPSEAEWEYAARAGTTTRFAQGFEPTPDQVNISSVFTEMLLLEDRPDLRTLGYPVPVDEMDAANPWGLRHMSGNADEVTLSCYTERYAGWVTASEWLAKSFGESCKRVFRGGGYGGPMSSARVASRLDLREANRNSNGGFRVVKELE
jgi:formylglycine-generating enzyme required for sulfatase activity